MSIREEKKLSKLSLDVISLTIKKTKEFCSFVFTTHIRISI